MPERPAPTIRTSTWSVAVSTRASCPLRRGEAQVHGSRRSVSGSVRRAERQPGGEAGHVERPLDPRWPGKDREVRAIGPRGAERLHHEAEPGRVDERRAAKVEHEGAGAGARELLELRRHVGHGGEVEIADVTDAHILAVHSDLDAEAGVVDRKSVV